MPGTLSSQQSSLAAGVAVAGTGILFLTNAADPVNIPKLTLLLLAAVAAGAAAAVTPVRTRRLALPWGLPAAAGAGLLLALVVATIAAPQSATAIVGTNGRNSGLLAYGAALTLYATLLQTRAKRPGQIVALSLLLSGAFTATYGVLQRLGIDSIRWSNPFNPIIASMGNPDFASAYLGITVPVAVWAACWTSWGRLWRVLSGIVALLCLLVAALSSAVQGPLAAAAGLAVVALALALDLPQARRRRAVAALGAAAAAGLLVVLAGAAGAGPARSFFSGISYDARTWYWRAAITMWRRSPVTGVGLDSYGLYWRRDRPLANPRAVGGNAYSDSAHSVPLQHLAQGGLLLAAAYLFFCGVIATALFRGIRRLRGQERLLLGGVGGAWVAYQVQSLVSIDQVPLLVLNFVLGAAVVVASGTGRVREFSLRGAPPRVDPQRGRKSRQPIRRATTPGDLICYGVIAFIGLTLAWFALTPLRASHAAYVGDAALASGDGNAAVAAYTHATELEPGIGRYRTSLGQTYNLGKRPDDARRQFARAFEVDAAEVNAGRTAARLAAMAGDTAQARRLFDRALSLDPSNSATVLDWADFQLAHGGAQQARVRLERAVRDLPGDAGLWSELGDARIAVKDLPGAKSAFERAVQLKPAEPAAVEGLKRVAAAGG